MATIAVDAATPMRPDTHVELDFQGLTGVPVDRAQGRQLAPPACSRASEPPASYRRCLGRSEHDRRRRGRAAPRLNGILAENAEPLHDTIANLNTFSAALARNSDRLDGIVAGLERMTGGGPSSPRTVCYDLTAPARLPPAVKTPRGPLAVAEPTARSSSTRRN